MKTTTELVFSGYAINWEWILLVLLTSVMLMMISLIFYILNKK